MRVDAETIAERFKKRQALFQEERERLDRRLLSAARGGQGGEIFVCLVEGADPNARDKDDDDNTALILTAKGGHTVAADILLQNWADPDLTNKKQQSALLLAIRGRHLKAAQIIWKFEPKVTAKLQAAAIEAAERIANKRSSRHTLRLLNWVKSTIKPTLPSPR